jgi:hypothetical protein
MMAFADYSVKVAKRRLMNTQAILDLLNFGFSVAKLIDTLLHGFSLALIGELLEVIRTAPVALSEAGNAWSEYKSLSDTDRATVDAYIVANFQIQEANIQAAVETVLELLVSLSSLLGMVKKGK